MAIELAYAGIYRKGGQSKYHNGCMNSHILRSTKKFVSFAPEAVSQLAEIPKKSCPKVRPKNEHEAPA